jgi:hypothetical protein
MTDITIRLYYRDEQGHLTDHVHDFGLETFAGCVPMVGDKFLHPGVLEGKDRRDYRNRELLVVRERIFNARDLQDYIMLVCEEQPLTEAEADIA